MNINKVTITGADNKISPKDLFILSQKYPFVEWGILFSKTKEGEARYPTKEWREELCQYDLNLSAHFCGWYSREVIENGEFELIDNLHSSYKRVQLNYRFQEDNEDNMDNWNLHSILRSSFFNNKKIILQWNNNNKIIIQDNLPKNDYIKNIETIHFLYDSSGGRGKEIDEIENPIEDYFTGYSGGISVDNIDNILEKISNKKCNVNTWIDIESGVRNSNNEFDLNKVEFILEKVRKFNENIKNNNSCINNDVIN